MNHRLSPFAITLLTAPESGSGHRQPQAAGVPGLDITLLICHFHVHHRHGHSATSLACLHVLQATSVQMPPGPLSCVPAEVGRCLHVILAHVLGDAVLKLGVVKCAGQSHHKALVQVRVVEASGTTYKTSGGLAPCVEGCCARASIQCCNTGM